jgi:hypothetical protein
MTETIEMLEQEHLKNIYEIAFLMTKDKTWDIEINNYNPLNTAFIVYDTHHITLTNQLFPIGLSKYPSIYLKMFDGELAHEIGHELITKVHNANYSKLMSLMQYSELAKSIKNIIEDKRVNYFIKLRYASDFGLRLGLLLRIIGDSTEKTNKKPEIALKLMYAKEKDFASYLLNLIVRKSLYEADLTQEEKELSSEQLTDYKTIIALLEKAKLQRVSNDLMNTFKQFYNIVAKYIKPDNPNRDKNVKDFIPKNNGGKMELELSEDTKEVKDEKEKQEKEAETNQAKEQEKEEAEKLKQKMKEKLEEMENKKTISEGSEIPAPKANRISYKKLVSKNQHLITELLNHLKQLSKPTTKRTYFKKNGILMNGILSNAYVQSLAHPVDNIYMNNEKEETKQKIAICLSFDSSGSVDREKLLDVMTITTEALGQYLKDNEFALNNFATDIQRIKTFGETYETTKARIPMLDCGYDNNIMIIHLLESNIRQFNKIASDYKKIQVIVSDFALLIPETRFNPVIEKMLNANIQPVFIGIDSWRNYINDYMANDKRVKRIGVNRMEELPALFIKIILEAINH